MESDDTIAANTIPTVEDRGMERGLGTLRYKFGELIGRGGMGEVVSARDEQIGRTVAVKRLRDATPEAVVRFLREAHVQGRLEHPAVVPVHELSHDERGPFFVMKQLAGVTLADVIGKLAEGDPGARAKYSRQRLLRDFAEICLAIEFAHTKGVVHRDLKPANIVLGEFGEVYVLDWGIARVLHDTQAESFDTLDTLDGGETQAGAILGTPGYMSPEQVAGDDTLDGRADVYALGCMLFEILALEPLHPRGAEGIASAVAGIDARPSRRMGGIPPELDAACVAAVAPRDARIGSARALGDLVQRFLDGDRDLALRRELAKAELAAAREAMAKKDARAAMQAASRALALDPASREPAELVGRLMLEPPTVAPPEVEEELAKIDLAALHDARPLAFWAALSYLPGIALLYWIGFRDWSLFVGGSLACIAIATIARVARGWLLIVTVIGGNLLMLAWIARLVSPFLITPGLGVIIVMGTASHPRYVRLALIVPLALGALLVPFMLEGLGLLHSTVAIAGGDVELHTTATNLTTTPTLVALVLLTAMMYTTAGVLASAEARTRRAAQRAVQIQKWQLRQLVPG